MNQRINGVVCYWHYHLALKILISQTGIKQKQFQKQDTHGLDKTAKFCSRRKFYDGKTILRNEQETGQKERNQEKTQVPRLQSLRDQDRPFTLVQNLTTTPAQPLQRSKMVLQLLSLP